MVVWYEKVYSFLRKVSSLLGLSRTDVFISYCLSRVSKTRTPGPGDPAFDSCEESQDTAFALLGGVCYNFGRNHDNYVLANVSYVIGHAHIL